MLDRNIEFSEFREREIDVLSDIASSLIAEDMNATEPVMAYELQIQNVQDLIKSNECAVLSGLLDMLLVGLKKLLDEKKPLTKDDCQFLKKVPDILSEYLLIPSSRIPDAHFFSHFKNADWLRLLTEDEKIFLQSLKVDTTGHDSEKLQVIEGDAGGDDKLEIDLSELLTTCTTEQDYSDMEVFDGLSLNKEGSGLTQENVDDDEDFIDIADLSSFVDTDNQAEYSEPETGDLDIADNVIDSVLPEGIEKMTGHDSVSSIEDTTESLFLISDEQKELVGLVIYEIDEIVSDKKLINVDDVLELKINLISIAEQLEKICNAIELIGLEGLVYVCTGLSSNMRMLSVSESTITGEQIRLIEAWPMMVISYLKNIASVKSSDDLIAYVKDPAWPEPVSLESRTRLAALLKKPKLPIEEKKLRQNKANSADMSLDLPEDVNPELLEGLLQDLPVQSGEFTAAIENLSDQNNLEYLEVAQRIAHTLKGAGNVVGVRGIANLTHHLEDILEIQSKANKLPSASLLTVLIDASDCLETMSEALLGINEAPDNSVSVFQSVLDWANKLDMEGATDFNEGVIDVKEPDQFVSAQTQSEPIEKSALNVQDLQYPVKRPVKVENMLRVPASLADDLLRLAGENMISTSQIQEYIKTIQSRHIGLKSHNQTLQQLSFDLEHIVDVQGIASSNNEQTTDSDFDPLELDQYHELHSMSRRLVEIAADSIELANVLVKDINQLSGLVINQDRLQKENETLVLKTRMVPTRTITPRLKRGVKQACRLTSKEVDIEIADNDTYMDSEILNSLIEPLMHLLRNSVDHGIESAEERQRKNKSNRGSIKLVFSRKGNQIVIDIKDDGRGLNLKKIKEKAVSKGMVNSVSEVTEANLKNFILQPGFSTSTEVSHISGRGIGLDVVHSKIRDLKGSIEINSVEGSGCHFSLTLPVSSFSIHSLLVRVREDVYAFSNRGIEEVLYPGLGDIENVGHETVFKLDDQVYKTLPIETLLSMSEDRREGDRNYRPVILVKDDSGGTVAIRVQELIDSRDVVVKSMGSYIPKIQGVIGATVLGDGSIAPVIDLPELIQSGSIMEDKLIHNDKNTDINIESSVKPPYVLIVDDSLSARKSLAQFVQDMGLEVRTARDGLEAVSLIDARKPGLVLVDMEMPGMNGLELTSYIRASDGLRELPVIMITSRSTDKHRQVAMDKGVNHFMVKPFIEDELASHINLALKIA